MGRLLFLQVLIITIGVVVFNFGAPRKAGKGAGTDSTYGLALIGFSLALDGATGGLQVGIPAHPALEVTRGFDKNIFLISIMHSFLLMRAPLRPFLSLVDPLKLTLSGNRIRSRSRPRP